MALVHPKLDNFSQGYSQGTGLWKTVENFGARIAGLLMGRQSLAKSTRSMESAESLRSATVKGAQPQKSFLLRTDKRQEKRRRCEKLGEGN